MEFYYSQLKALSGCCSCCCSGERGPRGPRGKQGPPGPKGEKGDQGVLAAVHGYGYFQGSRNQAGVVPLNVPGPLTDVELVNQGLKVLQSGTYQINYKVNLEGDQASDDSPSQFFLLVNDSLDIRSSLTIASSSMSQQTLGASVLFSLLEGDIVRLVADIPRNVTYSMPTLQVMKIG